MKVLETRETPEGFRRRRYETAAGHRFSTIEVPVELWQRVNTVGRQRNRARQAQAAIEREALRRQAKHLHAAGLAGREIARRLGVNESTIRRYIK
jgi:DNA-binding NarL/FixJ family response regulator